MRNFFRTIGDYGQKYLVNINIKSRYFKTHNYHRKVELTESALPTDFDQIRCSPHADVQVDCLGVQSQVEESNPPAARC